MQVTYQAFEFQISPKLSSEDFMLFIQSLYHQEVKFRGKPRVVFIDKSDDNWIGMVLTYADRRMFLEMKESSYTVKRRETDPGVQGSEVNLFCVNPSINLVLTTCYRGSENLAGMIGLFHKLHRLWLIKTAAV